MPKTAVQTPICDICGSEVRDGSLFCFNCGGSVSKLEEALEPIEVKPVTIDEEKNGHLSDPENYDPAKRRTERADRRRVRASNRQPVEIVWEPRTGVSWPFVVGSIVFVLFSFIVIFAAFYFR